MENLFINIQKYRPRIKINPKENFITEIFAFILKNNPDLFREFIKFINLPEFTGVVNNYNIKTQSKHDSSIIDMEIILNEKISIFVENKLDSPIFENTEKKGNETIVINQLSNYLKIQKKNTKYQGYVVLLTQYSVDLNSDIKNHPLFLNHLYWKDIYTLFKNCKSNEINNFLLSQFIDLMEYEGMDTYKKITRDMADAYKEFLDNIYRLFDEISEELNITINKRNISIYGVSFSFLYKGYSCYLTYNTDSNFYLYLYNLTPDQQSNIQDLNLKQEGDEHYILVLEGEDFFKYDSNKQFNSLKKSYEDILKHIN